MNISLRLATVLLLLQAGSTLGENSGELPLKAADQLLAHGSVKAARRQYEGLHRAAPDNPAILERLGIHSMYAQCHVNDKQPVLLYFDTGLVDDHGASILTSRDQLLDLGVPISGDSKSGYVDIPRVRVGSLERTSVKALYGTGTQLTYCEYLKPYGLIGHNFLKHYQWTIDFENRVFLFAY